MVKKRLNSTEQNKVLAKFVKNDLNDILPPNTIKVGLQVSAPRRDLTIFAQDAAKNKSSCAIFIGGLAYRDALSDNKETFIPVSISKYELSAAVSLIKIIDVCTEGVQYI